MGFIEENQKLKHETEAINLINLLKEFVLRCNQNNAGELFYAHSKQSAGKEKKWAKSFYDAFRKSSKLQKIVELSFYPDNLSGPNVITFYTIKNNKEFDSFINNLRKKLFSSQDEMKYDGGKIFSLGSLKVFDLSGIYFNFAKFMCSKKVNESVIESDIRNELGLEVDSSSDKADRQVSNRQSILNKKIQKAFGLEKWIKKSGIYYFRTK